MTRIDMFWMLLLTGLFGLMGVRELSARRFVMGSLMLLVPTAFWLALAFGRP
jgi:hypothetical protein